MELSGCEKEGIFKGIFSLEVSPGGRKGGTINLWAMTTAGRNRYYYKIILSSFMGISRGGASQGPVFFPSYNNGNRILNRGKTRPGEPRREGRILRRVGIRTGNFSAEFGQNLSRLQKLLAMYV